jgi:hypothetical protein
MGRTVVERGSGGSELVLAQWEESVIRRDNVGRGKAALRRGKEMRQRQLD